MTDWQPGDLALCVKGGKITNIPYIQPKEGYPKRGAIYTVEKVGNFSFVTGVTPALWFVNAPINTNGRVWAAKRFVKVTPGADIEGVEVERKVPKPVEKSEGIVA